MPKTKKLLLDNVSGRFLPGELTAILGPSGAGKTTLLKAISGYGREGVKGRIQAGYRRNRCYIGQEDLLAQYLTAGELIGFTSRLKLPEYYTVKQRVDVVEELICSLGLESCKDTRTECLSGGQKKRLAIALELISNPPIVFLDEPTRTVIELCENRRDIDVLCESSGNGTKSWYSIEADKKISQSLTSSTIERITPGADLLLGERTVCCSSTWNQFCVLLSRIHLQTKRNWVGLLIQLVHYLSCAIFVSSLFYNKANDGSEYRASANLCFSVVVFHTYTAQMGPAINYPHEVELLKREHFNQWYSLLPYYLSFRMSKIPYMVFLVLIFSLIVYSLSGLPWEVKRFCFFYAVGIMVSLSAEGLGLTIGSLFNVTNASIIGCLSLFPLLGLGTYAVDYMRHMPSFMEYIVKTSFIRQGFLALLIIIYGLDRNTLDCPQGKDFCFFSSPLANLYFMNLEEVSIWHPFIELFTITCFFWLTFYLALKWRLRC